MVKEPAACDAGASEAAGACEPAAAEAGAWVAGAGVAALLQAEATMARIATPVSAVQRDPAAPPTPRGEPKILIPLSSSSAVGGK